MNPRDMLVLSDGTDEAASNACDPTAEASDPAEPTPIALVEKILETPADAPARRSRRAPTWRSWTERDRRYYDAQSRRTNQSKHNRRLLL